jgi:glucose-1-phosphate adenylyltransferase
MKELNDLARDVIVVILGGGRGTRLSPLTDDRSKPAVPIAGKYRLIDIPISNAIHSQMERILLLTQFNSVSLHRHISQTYKFDPFSKGFVQVHAAQQTLRSDRWFQGTADAVRQSLPWIVDLKGDLVAVLSGDHMYRMDYRQMIREHLGSAADITIGVLPCSEEEIGEFGAVRVDGDGRILEFREKPKTAEAREGMEVSRQLLAKKGVGVDRPYLASMGIYLFRKDFLVRCLEAVGDDFGRDIIPASVAEHRVQAHFFQGYWRDIGTIRAFYDTHMDLVRPKPPFDFNDPSWPIYTRPRYLPPARINGCRFERVVLAEGSTVVDSAVEDSIVGIGSRMFGATVRKSLIMGIDLDPAETSSRPGDAGIGEGSIVERAIVDKNARLGKNVRIVEEGRRNDGEGPGWCIRDGIAVITRNADIPDDTIIL